jgi:hypothetical protein
LGKVKAIGGGGHSQNVGPDLATGVSLGPNTLRVRTTLALYPYTLASKMWGLHNLDSNFQIPFLSFKLYEREKSFITSVFPPKKNFFKKNHNQKLPIQNHITKITKIAKNSCLVWCFFLANLDLFLFAFWL